jgi:3-polyprenyl-4-hydroxybenzoate decarboxylase
VLKDLRDWIALLEREGELVRVSATVADVLEMQALAVLQLRS